MRHPDPARWRVQRRAVGVLAAAQVLGGVGVASGLAVGGLLAEQVSGSTARAGLATTMSVLGAALLAVPLARLAQRSGRRPALATGYVVASAGAVLCVLAGVQGRFSLLLVGMLLFGGGTASGLQARYAATDAAEAGRRARALSAVVWATTIGAVAGPNLSGPGARAGLRLGLPALTGPLALSVIAFVAAAVVIAGMLRPDPLLFSRAAAGPGTPATAARSAGRASAPAGTAHVLRVSLRSPRARFALVTIAAAHAVMVGVMVMTPLHLEHGGATLRIVGVVISVHIAGMYAASPVMGWIADRFGRETGIALGIVLLAAALMLAGTSAAGDDARLGAGLALLGLGWSACLVSGSTLLTESVPLDLRTAAQGLSDLVMGVAGAAAGALSGPLMASRGYPWLSLLAAALLVPVVFLGLTAVRAGAGAAPA